VAELNTDVRFVRGVGEARAKSLAKLGITDLKSLISYFPRAYEDRRESRRIAELQVGERACVTAMVASEPKLSRIRKGLELVKLRVVDESAALELTYFNQSYLKNTFHVGESYTFYGTVEGTLLRRTMTNPAFDREGLHDVTGCIVPVYPLTAGVGQSLLHRAIRQGLARARRTTVKGKTCAAVDMTPFFGALPFSLTGAQARAVDDILRDMTAERPMNRLVQGDVGSGKTMVAAAGIYFAAKNGLQAALMAPTEILAEQHYHTLAPLLEKLGVRCALLTASTKAKTRRSILEQLAAGKIDLAIGTHALLSPDISYQNLGLVVTDEQHRFGVNQRAALGAKGENPHLLVMSATPIPRTLALMIYGDLDVSVIDELPPGRRSIETYAVPSSYHERIYAFLEKQLAEGRQAYIVCPMVEENGELPDERKAVTAYAEKLQKEVLPNRTVRFLHGKMKAKEKETVMRAFAAGEIDVLVSTTVVEVGVDVPNASVMLIENAECFGLSQLHQLRGRVGRGPWQSYCILVSDNRGEDNKTRLDAMRRTQSGFALAEEDLKLRGPGDFFGARQHGLPTLRVADFACDMELLYEAQGAAEALLALDPRLEGHPALHARVRELFDLNAEALN